MTVAGPTLTETPGSCVAIELVIAELSWSASSSPLPETTPSRSTLAVAVSAVRVDEVSVALYLVGRFVPTWVPASGVAVDVVGSYV